MKVRVPNSFIAGVNRTIHEAWTGAPHNRPYWTDGMTSVDANEGIYHGSTFLGSISRDGKSGWKILSRHDTFWRSSDLDSLLIKFIETYQQSFEVQA